MGVLANHVPSIEQLKPGLVEVIEESGSKQFFRAYTRWRVNEYNHRGTDEDQYLADSPSCSRDRF